MTFTGHTKRTHDCFYSIYVAELSARRYNANPSIRRRQRYAFTKLYSSVIMRSFFFTTLRFLIGLYSSSLSSSS